MLRQLPFHEKLDLGEVALGCSLNFASPEMVEIIGLMKFDFLMLDAEHGAVSAHQAAPLLQAADRANLAMLVRVPSKGSDDIGRYLDLGATGIVFPNIENAADAHAAVNAVRFPPAGERGLAPHTPASGYGVSMPYQEYLTHANRLLQVVLMIESGEGVANIDEILGIEGVSAVLIGPMDLSASLGVPTELSNLAVRGAVDRIIARCAAAGTRLILSGGDIDQGTANIQRGAAMLLTPLPSLLLESGTAFVSSLRQSAARDTLQA